MSFQITSQITLQEAVTRVAALVGFPAPADPVSSGDPAAKQLVLAVNESGRELLGLYPWSDFIRNGSQIMDSADVVPPARYAEYDLPEDFLMFIDQTQWNASTQLPGIGPINPQQWQQLQVRLADTLFQITWRVAGGKLQANNPGTQQEFVYQYISQAWVQDGDTPTQFKNVASRNNDVLLLDDFLLVRLARAKWLEYKGFDNSAAMRDFLNSAESRFGQAKGAPTLNLARGGPGYRYLGYANMPDTNYGF